MRSQTRGFRSQHAARSIVLRFEVNHPQILINTIEITMAKETYQSVEGNGFTNAEMREASGDTLTSISITHCVRSVASHRADRMTHAASSP
jgi:hypothetical protein